MRGEPRAAAESIDAGDGFRVARHAYPLDAMIGRAPLRALTALDAGLLAALAASTFDARGARFFDVETTGFERDASSRVFLVGAGRIEGDAFVVEQVLLTRFDAEARYLDAVDRALGGSGHLVSFFGKTFDRHHLDDRFERVHRRRRLRDREHLDLQSAARRLFGAELADCRLRTLERRVLGIERSGDLAGGECPAAWMDFLDDAESARGRIDAVLRHNRLDVLALAALTIAVEGALRAPRGPLQSAAAGRLLAERGGDGCADRARAALRAALVALNGSAILGLPDPIRRAAFALADLERTRDPEAAIAALSRLAAADPREIDALRRAARIAERELKDRPRAANFAEEALCRAQRSRFAVDADEAATLVRLCKRLRGAPDPEGH